MLKEVIQPLQGHKCLSASTFTVPPAALVVPWRLQCHKCLSASTFTVPRRLPRRSTPDGSQMPIGKYIYCTGKLCEIWQGGFVTNAYRQVHLLYSAWERVREPLDKSQMPIGKYIYCTHKSSARESREV